MPFNWFRRQQKDGADKSQELSSKSDNLEPKPDGESPTETSDESAKAAAEDYLAWAKAAYKNIQKEQEIETVDSSTTTTISPEVEEKKVEQAEAEVSAPAIEEGVEFVAAAQEAEAVTEEDKGDLEVAAAQEVEAVTEESAITSEEITPESLEVSEAVVEEVEEISEAMPFWARAQAERQARLERLKETAIEEPEPETLQTATTTSQEVLEEILGIPFDEGFLWSAEILASQGLRPEQISVEEITWLKKLRLGLERTRRSLINRLKAIVGQGPLNEDAVMEIEALLLQADVGVEATDDIVEALQAKLREEVLPPEEALAYLKQILRDILDKPCQDESGKPVYSFTFAPEKDSLNIWIITGVNGAGKTTTIGKIANLAKKSDYRALIAAADTFRAAATEQVKVWGERSGVSVIANQGKNTDPAAVVFDAIAAAKARETELLIVDTAGRLQNKKNLMEELSKIRRVVDKKAPEAIVESLLVLDATLGQNGLRQAEVFSQSAKLSGVVLTKLDGTAKGGVALAVVKQLGLPIRFIGVGESIEDLRPFSSYEFVEALLSG